MRHSIPASQRAYLVGYLFPLSLLKQLLTVPPSPAFVKRHSCVLQTLGQQQHLHAVQRHIGNRYYTESPMSRIPAPAFMSRSYHSMQVSHSLAF